MADSIQSFVKFVSRKISKIKWQPSQKQTLECSDTFVTGSWDDEKNKICLWHLGMQESMERDEMDDGLEPALKCEADHNGDVTGLEYIGSDVIVASSSTGSVTLYKHHTSSQTMGTQYKWQSLHSHGNHLCPCTCLAVRDKTIVTAGEDGKLVVLSAEQKSPQRVIENADSSTINGLVFLRHTEVISVNSSGQLKTFDLRSSSDAPAQTLSVSGELTSLHSVDRHPGQPHIVATGSGDGVLGIWDLRQEKSPVSLLEAHSGPVWEVKFHKTTSDHLFTCSEDGAVWHWDSSLVGASHMVQTQITGTGAGSGGANFSVNPSFQFGGSETLNKMATYTEYSQASSVDSYRNTPNQNISTGRQNSAEAHVSFNHKNKEEEKDKRQKYLTAKYGQHQMMLIRKRLAVEDWLYDKLRELYDCQDDSDDHDCKLDLEDVLNLDTDVERREYAQRELVNAQVSREEVERFIDELIKKSKTL